LSSRFTALVVHDTVVDVLDVVLDNQKSQRRNPGDVFLDVQEQSLYNFTYLHMKLCYLSAS
jgi:hypothetical protein